MPRASRYSVSEIASEAGQPGGSGSVAQRRRLLTPDTEARLSVGDMLASKTPGRGR